MGYIIQSLPKFSGKLTKVYILQAGARSISKNIRVPHAVILLPRSGNVGDRFRSPPSVQRIFVLRLNKLDSHDSSPEFLLINWILDNWGMKAKRRKTTGTGRMRSMKEVPRKFKNGFQTGAPKGARGTSANPA